MPAKYIEAASGHLEAAFMCPRHSGRMTGSSIFSRRVRNIGKAGLTLAREERGAAIVEMALVLPLLLALLMGVLVYGQYFMLAHNVQQAANDGARASIVCLDPPHHNGRAAGRDTGCRYGCIRG